MLKKSLFLLAAILLILTACSAPRAAQPAEYYTNQPELDRQSPGQPADEAAQTDPASAGSNGDAAVIDRLVIKNASLQLVVQDPALVVETIATLAETANGFVVTSNVYQISVDAAGNKFLSGKIAVRVPAEKLEEILAQIKAQALTVKSENITGEDVTAQYVDLASQLKNLEAAAEQLQTIMDNASKTEDVLAVYKELTLVQGQIEQVKGQMKYYTEAAAMSLISVALEQDRISQPIETGGWKPEGVLKDIVEAWGGAYRVGVTLGMWLGGFCLPLLLIVGLPLGLILYGISRLRRKNKPPKPEAA